MLHNNKMNICEPTSGLEKQTLPLHWLDNPALSLSPDPTNSYQFYVSRSIRFFKNSYITPVCGLNI